MRGCTNVPATNDNSWILLDTVAVTGGTGSSNSKDIVGDYSGYTEFLLAIAMNDTTAPIATEVVPNYSELKYITVSSLYASGSTIGANRAGLATFTTNNINILARLDYVISGQTASCNAMLFAR